jgi:hypothetical protein
VRITSGALKHGVTERAVRAVLAGPLRRVPQGGRTLLIGLGDDRDLIEIVHDGEQVLHAMRLRPKHYGHLTGEPDDLRRVTDPAPGAADASPE